MAEARRNWAGNYSYQAPVVRYPENIEELSQMVARAPHVRALGTRHAFNSMADTSGEQISLTKFDRISGIDCERMTVTAQAGVRYGHLGKYLHERGYAFENLASLPHISIAGACATATHGSGDKHGNLATSVVAMEMVKADGQVVELSRESHGEVFDGMVVHLGALGIVTAVTLKIEPTFHVQQFVYENLPISSMENHFEEIVSSAYSVSFFTNWQGSKIAQVWRKCLQEKAATAAMLRTFFGATLSAVDLHPTGSQSAENCAPQCGVAGPWFERLPHFKMEFTPSSGEELQSEYFVPRRHAVDAILAVTELRNQITPHLFVSEIRTIAADNLWMSPCYQEACVGIHFTWKPHWPTVRKLLPAIEEKLAPFKARPHWAKLFAMNHEQISPSYPRLNDFKKLATEFDPHGKFRNDFLKRYVFG
ncbi:MAG TPA: FAD-binding protein [Tepidisphaeraceae bacterium]|jgi:xylitol oxidase